MKIQLLSLVFIFFSCTKNKIKVIDGCQYIQTISVDGSESLAHKGNCNNPFHNKILIATDTAKPTVSIKYYDLTKIK
jgi:hypothetical protein